jgi:hypothetical protein
MGIRYIQNSSSVSRASGEVGRKNKRRKVKVNKAVFGCEKNRIGVIGQGICGLCLIN